MTTSKPPKKADHRRLWITYQLSLRGTSFSTIAREHGVSRQAVQHVNSHPYPKWEKVIADKLGMAPRDIWPERYSA